MYRFQNQEAEAGKWNPCIYPCIFYMKRGTGTSGSSHNRASPPTIHLHHLISGTGEHLLYTPTQLNTWRDRGRVMRCRSGKWQSVIRGQLGKTGQTVVLNGALAKSMLTNLTMSLDPSHCRRSSRTLLTLAFSTSNVFMASTTHVYFGAGQSSLSHRLVTSYLLPRISLDPSFCPLPITYLPRLLCSLSLTSPHPSSSKTPALLLADN